MEFWKLTEILKEVVDNRGKSVPTTEAGFPLIATNCIKDRSIYPVFENIRYVSQEILSNWFRSHLMPNDILFVNKGTPGKVCLVPSPVNFCAAQDMIGLRVNDRVYYKYLFLVLKSNFVQKTIENNHVGLVIPHFKKQDLKNILVPKRTYKEQTSIGDLYINLSEKIELNNRINTELEAMAKLLYDYWFVQFDFPNEEGKPYKSSGGEMNYCEVLKREVPLGWEGKRLKELVNCNKWSLKKMHSYDKINYLDTSNLTENTVDIIQEIDTTIEKVPSRAKRIVEKDDILYSTVRPEQKHFGIIKNPVENMIASTGFVQLRPKSKSISNDLIYLFLTTKSNTEKLQQIAQLSVSSYPSISPNDVLDLKLALPKDLNKIKTISNYFNTIHLKISKHQQQNLELQSLRDWLLPMLMNGQVQVS